MSNIIEYEIKIEEREPWIRITNETPYLIEIYENEWLVEVIKGKTFFLTEEYFLKDITLKFKKEQDEQHNPV